MKILLRASLMPILQTVVLLGCLTSCVNIPRHEVMGLELGLAEKQKQNEQLKLAEAQYDAGQFELARGLYQEFKSKNASSPYYQRAQLGEAKSLEKLGDWSQAASLFRDMVEATRIRQPEIAAEALYLSSYCYEALGDEARVLAALNDAERMKESLPAEVALAEIPARFAASYNRAGRLGDAKKSLALAEAGILQLKNKQGDRLSSGYFAKVYSQMGVLSTNQLSTENFMNSIETLKSVQSFALRSIELNDPVHSLRALEGLRTNYRDLYTQIQQVSFNRALDLGAAKREQTERKSLMASNLLLAIEVLRQSHLSSEVEAQYSQQLFSYLQDIETKLVTFLHSRGELNELTPEALKLKSLKKNIIIQSEPLFPNEKRQDP